MTFPKESEAMEYRGACELVRTCLFFRDNMKTKPNTVEFMKKKYCHEDKATCARYMVVMALGKESVPPDLYPNDLKTALEIIGGRRAVVPSRPLDRGRP